jgi:hypothetical protein
MTTMASKDDNKCKYEANGAEREAEEVLPKNQKTIGNDNGDDKNDNGDDGDNNNGNDSSSSPSSTDNYSSEPEEEVSLEEEEMNLPTSSEKELLIR